ncbi:glycosyltransferase family 39 protein [Patescibacteria group bacterium]|nr:glycosyltransferase family 39 protein [Patescibacteria group bacterium]
MRIFKSIHYLFLTFLISLLLFYPAFSTFFTNDDFFHLAISKAQNLKDFLSFFNLLSSSGGFPNYRPLSVQVYYFLGRTISGLEPISYRLISFAVFFLIIYLVYLLVKRLTKSETISLLSAFLYATSATHFAHLYYAGAFQELSLALFFLAASIYFFDFLQKTRLNYYLISIAAFILALMSKETAVVLPFILTLLFFYSRNQKAGLPVKRFAGLIMPYFLILSGYFYLRVFHYGFATGDSYIWDFSIKRVVNTLGWYGLWSFNLPEMLVDFVGPGLHLNPNLFKFWSSQIIPIFILFVVETVSIFFLTFKSKILNRKSTILILFCVAWFIITLVPVLFLPLHKFTFYLTLPLVGVVMLVGYLIINLKSRIINLFLITIWLLLSILTLRLTYQTNWITQGAKTAKNVYVYFQTNAENYKGKTIVFYDTKDDSTLPWSPTQVLKDVLSNNNFFKVFYPGGISVVYGGKVGSNTIAIPSRQFLGY